MDIRMKWFYRLGFLLLFLVVIFVFYKLQTIWLPVVRILLIIFVPFFIAAFLTYLLHPIVEKLHEKNLPRWLAVLIICILFFGGFGFALYKGVPAFIVQLRDLTENAPNFSNQYREWILLIQQQTSTWPDGLQDQIDGSILAVERALNALLEKVLNIVMNILDVIILLAIIPFIAFYMLKDFELMKKSAWYMTPRKCRQEAMMFIRDVDKSLGNYIRGQLLVCAVVGSLSALLFWLIGMKYPLLLGSIVALTNIIPYFGPVIGALPAVVIAATISMKMVIYSVSIIFVLQFLEGNVLSPLIVGKSLHMHPLIIMFALLAGGEIGGIMGLILAVPILAVLKVSILHAKYYFVKSKTESAGQH